jgi:aminopeptidase-like protein
MSKLSINTDFKQGGRGIYKLVENLYPICRSITGNGVRKTLNIIRDYIPLDIIEIPTGTKVYDWVVPEEWNISDAYIKNSKGKKIIDFHKSNLHIMSYSVPVNKKMSLKELKEHLHTLPDHPEWVPYHTAYYDNNWGFCLSQRQFEQLEEGDYEVIINSVRKKGFLTYGEYYLKGKSEEEIVLTSYVCHPSLCNDNLSGVALLTYLAKYMQGKELKYSYRFLFIPETIGAITWLNRNEDKISKVKCGLVITCVGDRGKLHYKKTRHGNSIIDKAVEKVLTDSGDPHEILDFFPLGSDERQFSSPGFNLEFGSLMRSVYGHFPEYHTSADDLTFVNCESLADSFKKYLEVLHVLENDNLYLNLNSKCEPQLGKRGLYDLIGGKKESPVLKEAIFWVLNFSDGKNSLLDISIRSRLNFKKINQAAALLMKTGLIRVIQYSDNVFINLRKAEEEKDSHDLWTWRNHPEVRKWCFSNSRIKYKDHAEWFRKTISSNKESIYIAENLKKEKIGQIRFKKYENSTARVNVNLNPLFLGKKYGSELIKKSTKIFFSENIETKKIIAEIMDNNVASKKAFEKAGYFFLKHINLQNKKNAIYSYTRSDL